MSAWSFGKELTVFGLVRKASESIVRRYVGFPNARNLPGVISLLHPDCCLIDSFGDRIDGRDAVVAATERFFDLEPSFHMRINALIEHQGDILLRGETQASRPEFHANATWRARIENDLILCWQSFGLQASARLAHLLGG